MGNGLAKILPDHVYSFWGNRIRFSLNPGKFSKKEHLLIAILAGSGASAAYAGEIISVQELYYHQKLSTMGGLILLCTTQLIGFGLAGLLNRVLVRPTASESRERLVEPFTVPNEYSPSGLAFYARSGLAL